MQSLDLFKSPLLSSIASKLSAIPDMGIFEAIAAAVQQSHVVVVFAPTKEAIKAVAHAASVYAVIADDSKLTELRKWSAGKTRIYWYVADEVVFPGLNPDLAIFLPSTKAEMMAYKLGSIPLVLIPPDGCMYSAVGMATGKHFLITSRAVLMEST